VLLIATALLVSTSRAFYLPNLRVSPSPYIRVVFSRSVRRDQLPTGTSAGFWLGGRCPLAARGEENFEMVHSEVYLKYI